MDKEITIWSNQCLACQKWKIHRHNSAPFERYELTNKRFNHINVDIVGPLPPSNDYRYLVTIIDRYTRWPKVIPTKVIRAETVASAIIEQWISRCGTPAKIITDQGRRFESELITNLQKDSVQNKFEPPHYIHKQTG